MRTLLNATPTAALSVVSAGLQNTRGIGKVAGKRSTSIIGATAICLVILIAALVGSSACSHWFVIPLFGCGLICCMDGLRIFEPKGRELFSPVAILGVFGLYFFYIAPLLHVGLDYWFITASLPTDGQPDDWRPWLGLMGAVNLVGLILYKASVKRFTNKFLKTSAPLVYQIDRALLGFYGPILLVISFLAQLYIFVIFGGIGGFINAFDNLRTGDTTFQGLGWLMCIAESFPVLFLIVWAAHFKSNSRAWSAPKISFVLPLMFPLILVFGGLRGSRGNTVFAIMYVVGIIHLTLRRVTWRLLTMVVAGLVLFMYVYGFYKVNQQTFVEAVSSMDSMTNEGERTGRNLDAVLLGDMDRADVQAFTLFQMLQEGRYTDYAYGRTYTDSALNFIPHAFLPDRPPGKIKYGTNLFYGNGTYAADGFKSTKIYGLAGEAMLNFGPLAVFVGFVFLGAVVGYIQAFTSRLSQSDSRQYLVPIISITCIVGLSSDFDNVLYVLLRQALMPALLIWLCSTRARVKRGVAFARPVLTSLDGSSLSI